MCTIFLIFCLDSFAFSEAITCGLPKDLPWIILVVTMRTHLFDCRNITDPGLQGLKCYIGDPSRCESVLPTGCFQPMSQPGTVNEARFFLGESGSSDGQIWLKDCMMALPDLFRNRCVAVSDSLSLPFLPSLVHLGSLVSWLEGSPCLSCLSPHFLSQTFPLINFLHIESHLGICFLEDLD